MTGFIIRIASPNDETSVSALLDTCYSTLMAQDYSPDILAKALPLICHANPKLLSSQTYYVAETPSGLIIGCGGWTKERPGSGQSETGLGHIRHFATHPNWIRHGGGAVDYRKCKTDAHHQGVRKLECYSSLSAQSFYAAMAFKVIGPIDIPLQNACLFPSVHMVCEL